MPTDVDGPDDAAADATPLEDVPHDVRAALTQLLAEARSAARADDIETTTALLETAETVATNKLPPGDRRDRIRRGCVSAADALPDTALAAAYAEAARSYVAAE
mgnify:FL=1|jgi:hypothetical protein